MACRLGRFTSSPRQCGSAILCWRSQLFDAAISRCSRLAYHRHYRVSQFHLDSAANNSDSGAMQEPQYHYIDGGERLEYYRPGGLHPVKMGDQLNGRYHIVHKLGYGSFSTTWLARDSLRHRFVAVKIARSEFRTREVDILRMLNDVEQSRCNSGSGHKTQNEYTERLILPLLDTFVLEGPNGQHPCYVTEAAACSLSDTKGGSEGGLFRLEVARALAAQLACAVAVVHSQGLVHGDLHLGNVLLRLPHHINHMTDQELYQRYGDPYSEQVLRLDGKPLSPHVPSDIYGIIATDEPCSELALKDARILLADFGASFSPSCDAELQGRAPLVVRPPEDRFEPEISQSFHSDIWTLGCAFWNLLAWRSPFETFFPDEDAITARYVDAIGPLPAAWWTKWQRRGKYFTDQGTPTEEWTSQTLDQRFDKIQELRQEKNWPPVDPEERTAFLVMIRSMFTYIPRDRPTIQQVLESQWMRQWALPELEKLRKGSDESL